MSSSSLRTVVLSTLPLESRESLLFSLASEIDPNTLHFSLLPDAENPHRDPNTPVVAVTWKLSRQHPILAKVGGMEVPQYAHHQQQQQQVNGAGENFNHHHPLATITPRKAPLNSLSTPYQTKIANSTTARRNQQQQRTSPNNNNNRTQTSPITRTSSNNSDYHQNNNNNNIVIEQILTVSPVIRGSPTPFQKQMMRRPSPFSNNRNRTTTTTNSAGRNRHPGNNNNDPNAETRSPQWTQRHVDDFLHFAAKSGVDTVQHNSVSFAAQCFLQYQSAVASTIRNDFHDLERSVEAYKNVCPASRLLHFLWKQCDDFSGVACLSFLSSIRFNDQIISPRQVISLASKVQTVAGHSLLINRKYLRVQDTVAVLRLATRRWNLHAAAFAKKQILNFLRSHRDVENAVAFDYVRHVDLYAVLLQLGKCYVLTNAGRSGPVVGEDEQEDFFTNAAGLKNPSFFNQQQTQQNGFHHEIDPELNPEKVGGERFQQHELYREPKPHNNNEDDDYDRESPVPNNQQQNIIRSNNNTDSPPPKNIYHQTREEVSVSPNTPAPNNHQQQQRRQSPSPRMNGYNASSPSFNSAIPSITPFVNSSSSSYAQKFQDANNRNQQQQQQQQQATTHSRSSAWSKRITSAQQTLEQVMQQFEDIGTSSSPNKNGVAAGKYGYLRETKGNSSPSSHSAGRMRMTVVPNQNHLHVDPNNNNNNNTAASSNMTMMQDQRKRGESLRESLERQVGIEEGTGKPIMGRDRGSLFDEEGQQQQKQQFAVAEQQEQQTSKKRRSPSQEVETVVIGAVVNHRRSASAMSTSSQPPAANNTKSFLVSQSNPRARSDEPPIPTPEDANLDPISAALAEQVRKTLENRRQSLRSESASSKSQLELIASPT